MKPVPGFRRWARQDTRLAGGKPRGYQKYHSVPTVVDGIRFPSKGQAGRYLQLKLRERAGDVLDLRLEVPFILEVNGIRICEYRADFVYRCKGAAVDTVEDFKGYATPMFKLKKRLMKAILGIEVLET